MAVGKEIRTKIKSIQGTQKITRAMEMVAASKMRKVQERMESTRPYASRIHHVVEHMSKCHPESPHPFLQDLPLERVGIIVVSTDRGLCGGLNINLFRKVLEKMEGLEKQGIKVDLCVLGTKAESFFKSFGGNVVAVKTHLGEKPTTEAVIGPVQVMLNSFAEGRMQALYLANNIFENTMSQVPAISTLFPLAKMEREDPEDSRAHLWDYIYEPDAKSLLDLILRRYIESQVYRGVVENVACEQAARMVAMKSASDNAGDLIDSLQLSYNKARQASITQELSEIVSGAAAV